MKTCSRCHRPESEVEIRKGRRCVDCVKEYHNERYRTDPEFRARMIAKTKRSYAENPTYRARQKELKHEYQKDPEYRAKRAAYVRKSLYGISQEGFDLLFVKQNGLCAICGTNDPGKKGFHVDHDHVTGKVRWLLCGHCNLGLGHFRDNPEILRKAAAALENLRISNG